MDANSKIWNWTQSGYTFHAFGEGGVALCRSNIRTSVTPHRDRDAAQDMARRTPWVKMCANCESKYSEAIVYAETVAAGRDRDHAEAMEMNTAFDAQQTPECTCPVMERKYYGGDKPHHPGCATRASERRWAVGTKGWEMHIVRGNKALCERPVNAVRLTDAEANNKLVANKLTRKCFGCIDHYQKENDMPSLDQRVTTGPLTPRQGKILAEVSAGREHADIAQELKLSRTAVSEDVRVIVAKMKVANTAQAIGRYGRYKAYTDAADLLMAAGIRRGADLHEAEEHANHVIEGLANELRGRAEKMLPQ
jgi:DNA-binding CsgD family transcriptional regulator